MLREDSASPEKFKKTFEKVLWKHLAHLQIKKANITNVIEYIASKIQTLSSRSSPDIEKETWRATTTKVSRERNNVTVFKKNDTMTTKAAMDTDMVNINQETLFNKVKFSYVVPLEDLKHKHPYIKSLFYARKIPNVQLAGSLKNLIGNC